MGIKLVGDVHGKFAEFERICEDEHKDTIIQLGDMGIGFKSYVGGGNYPYNHPYPKDFSKGVYFIRGNHDNPEVCREHPNYLGEYGYNKELDIYYIGGAWSIDWEYRVMGYNMWCDEELSTTQLSNMIEDFGNIKPRRVISHDCPLFLYGREFFNKHWIINSSTSLALQKAFEVHQPEYWAFGHHHVSKRKYVRGTIFQCLNELEVCDLDK